MATRALLYDPADTNVGFFRKNADGTTSTLLLNDFLTALGLADAQVFKGSLSGSGNPNYPAGSAGDTYKISVAGRVGGGSGKVVEVGDALICSADNAGGTEASVGTSWFVIQSNISGIEDVPGLQAALDTKVPTTRTLSGGGLATGGGDLSANRTITVPAASQVEAEAGTVATVVMTPQRTAQAIAALASTMDATKAAYCDPSGNDGTGVAGKPGKPFATVQAAWTAAKAASGGYPVVILNPRHDGGGYGNVAIDVDTVFVGYSPTVSRVGTVTLNANNLNLYGPGAYIGAITGGANNLKLRNTQCSSIILSPSNATGGSLTAWNVKLTDLNDAAGSIDLDGGQGTTGPDEIWNRDKFDIGMGPFDFTDPAWATPLGIWWGSNNGGSKTVTWGYTGSGASIEYSSSSVPAATIIADLLVYADITNVTFTGDGGNWVVINDTDQVASDLNGIGVGTPSGFINMSQGGSYTPAGAGSDGFDAGSATMRDCTGPCVVSMVGGAVGDGGSPDGPPGANPGNGGSLIIIDPVSEITV